ncbi:bifunctional metallophosphatase/5'-nucleotidase [Carboxylicivirga sp. RSCT41]|uniref:bifunctional metallophosphatase/5'-nucleotidase n=1 Tax=Carboxylicivirga agarovorans TaxID=3417570 RepID=UPI003D337A3D
MKSLNMLLTVFITVFLLSCSNSDKPNPEPVEKSLTIFFINDQHGQIDNFSKIKHIIDTERLQTNVIVACSGDMFSGNPVVDNASEEGAPMIDLMNRIGFDISVIGNHEFDYGQEVLKNRMNQADFEWVCANVDMSSSDIPQPKAYHTISKGDLNICFLGLVETYGKDGAIPSTHPNKVKGISFEDHTHVTGNYAQLKYEEECDLLVALTHIGLNSDKELAKQHTFFDLIIGGHSHSKAQELINGTPVFQAGSYLNQLGKITLVIKNQEVIEYDYDIIELSSYRDYDADMQLLIDDYNNLPYLKEIIGYSHNDHDRSQVGCFYTDALRNYLDVNVSFQNTGGVRSGLYSGDISRREIFEISPFKNGVIKYEMSVLEIKQFLIGSASGFYYSGVRIEQNGQTIIIHDLSGNELSDETILTIGINDFIPAVHDDYFPDAGELQPLTAAQTLMAYLEEGDGQVDYQNCNRYFRYH